MISEITTFLTHDVRHILGEEDEGSVAVGLLVPQIDASLLMPSIATATEVHGERETESSSLSITSRTYFKVALGEVPRDPKI